MNAQRLSVKLFTDGGARLATADALRLFHRCIQERLLDETMVDVADYSHLRAGPGVLLICHDAHYGLDDEQGAFGLTYHRKRDRPGDFGARLFAAVRATLVAARIVEEQGNIRFSGRALGFQIRDRLLAPNDDATWSTVQPHLLALCARLYPGATPELAREKDPKRVFGARITVEDELDLTTLLARIG